MSSVTYLSIASVLRTVFNSLAILPICESQDLISLSFMSKARKSIFARLAIRSASLDLVIVAM